MNPGKFDQLSPNVTPIKQVEHEPSTENIKQRYLSKILDKVFGRATGVEIIDHVNTSREASFGVRLQDGTQRKYIWQNDKNAYISEDNPNDTINDSKDILYDQTKKEELERIENDIKEGLKILFPQIFNSDLSLQRFHSTPDFEKNLLSLIEQRVRNLPPAQRDPLIKAFCVNDTPEYVQGVFLSEPRVIDIITRGIKGNYTSFHGHNSNPAHELVILGQCLKGDMLDIDTPMEDLRTTFKGKKILILGEELGTLSQALNALGAEAYGIEYNKRVVAIAHSGVLAENLIPQTQVIEGDLWNLGDSESSLFKLVSEKGPFDAIFSHGVFNSGSGFTEGAGREYSGEYPASIEDIRDKTRKRGWFDENSRYQAIAELNWRRFFSGLTSLTKPDGLNIHNNIDQGIRDRLYYEVEFRLKKLLASEDQNKRDYARTELEKLQEYYAQEFRDNIFIEKGNAHTYFEKVLKKLEEFK
jgi:hypothetical protein